MLIAMLLHRKTLPLLVDGSFRPFVPDVDLMIILAFGVKKPLPGKIAGKSNQNQGQLRICVLVNRAAQMLRPYSCTSKHAGY